MKKVLILLLTVVITSSGFIGSIYAKVSQNGNGSNTSAPVKIDDGIDSCSTRLQYCGRGRYVEAVAYRLTFVYAKDGGKYKMVPNANNSTKFSDSIDFWSTDHTFSEPDYLAGYGSRGGHQASKIEYKNGTNLWRIGNRNNSSTYKQNVNYIRDSGLNKFLGKDGYNGKKVMEYFSGTEATEYKELVDLAKRMYVIKATDTISNLAAISTDSEGYVLKLLIEPISYFMMGTGNGKTTWTGGFFTATEIAMILRGDTKYSVKTTDGNRATCVFPLRGYLTSDDDDLGFDAYSGSTKCNSPFKANYIFDNLGVMVVSLDNIFPKECKLVFRTIALSNPFPGHNGDTRLPGDNWQSTDNSLVEDYILNNRDTSADSVYNLNPMYRITLTPTLIQQIRSYNSSVIDGYSNNSLTNCDSNGNDCQSTFIRNIYRSNFSGCAIDGTC